MSLRKLQEYHRDMAMCEVLLRYTRMEILEEFADFISSIDVVHTIMNDPLVREYKDHLREMKEKRILDKKMEIEKSWHEKLISVSEEFIKLATGARSEHVKARVCRDILMGTGAVRFKKDEMEKGEIPHISVYDKKKDTEKERKELDDNEN